MKIYDNKIVYDILLNRIPTPTYQRIRREGEFYLATSAMNGDIVSLNDIAGTICTLCDGKKTIKEIYNELVIKYPEVEKVLIRFDLCKCIVELESFNMLTVIKM
ncbi:PqqD family peptide modification chaperone [Clostridioides difficile]|nr:PqqD family peptide modification chaperone [Clostridioides difficile]MCZ1114102.1 PqqD family peptide modification chaperone [Clostridioides difficile]MDI6393631.1 PqqD family peptide modification chaperone [Clostridioides difficile]